MKNVFGGLSSDEPQDARRQQLIIEFWNELRTCGESGATTWEVLDSLERLVTECLDHRPPDLGGAESLTALAALLMMGCSDL